MLTLVLGRAGSGKTSYVMNEIKRRAQEGERGLYLLVPEQYSHDAERQLCRICGDSLSMHGEALSFTGLSNRVFAQTGGVCITPLDAGGQILAMRRALNETAGALRVFGRGSFRAEILEKLLEAAREFKSLSVTPERLEELSELTDGPLGDKLYDLSVIMSAYDAFFSDGSADPSARLDRLSDVLEKSTTGESGHIYIDGFNDFTAQEIRVISGLMKKNDVTVCLTCEDLQGGSEIFALPEKTAARLIRLAGEYGLNTMITRMKTLPVKAPELLFMEQHLFGGEDAVYPDKCGAIEIYSAPNIYTECEYAAHKVLELVQSGLRRRDIGVMARDWTQYGPVCENVFEKYKIEFFSSGRADILQKPLSALVDAALEIVTMGWEYRAVFRYLKTGLADIAPHECAELENYVLKWKIRGTMWTREQLWTLPPSGYGGSEAGEQNALIRINEQRRRITEPLKRLQAGIKGFSKASDKLFALYNFLDEIKLPERLEQKAEELNERGELRLSDEYVQLWDVLKNAMEQFYAILGEAALEGQEFRKMVTLVLSQYGVGVIPVSLDRTALGDMAMSRRRDLKCLIILGASDGSLPKLTPGAGVFSANERDELCKLGADMPAGHEDRLRREMNMIYSSLTLPSERLILSYNTSDGGRASFIIKRMKTMFNLGERTLRAEEYMTSSEDTCYELAAMSGGGGIGAFGARKYFEQVSGAAADRLFRKDSFINSGRTKLDTDTAHLLYGHKPSLSPSRIEKYYACAFAHFLQNGLKLYPRLPAGFDAPEAGTFTHFVLENVTREIKRTVGFKNADAKLIEDLTGRYIAQYAENALYGFKDLSRRFKFLFDRLAEDTKSIVPELIEELKKSDFEPLDFELNLAEIADGRNLRGIIDRVDGWEHNGKLYLRVLDYKTGKKPFILSDVLHGMGMQMLIYLFALCGAGLEKYGTPAQAAGVLYVPAREVIIKTPRTTPEEEIKKLREKALRRGGLVLNDPEVLEAMENGPGKIYIPAKTGKDGLITGDAVADKSQLEVLSRHVGKMLKEAERGILEGNVSCEPYYRSPEDNACLYCQYRAVCGFSEEAGNNRRFIQRQSAKDVWEILEKTEDKK